jgi:hypothetical protein
MRNLFIFGMEETMSNSPENKSGTNKTAIVVAIAAVGVLVVAGALFLMRGSGEEEMQGVTSDDARQEMDEQSESAMEMSFRDLLGMGKSQKCTFSDQSDAAKSEGTFYVSGNRGRAMISNTMLSEGSVGATTTSQMLFDTAKNTMYVWDETTKQGMKMMMDQAPESPAVQDDEAGEEAMSARLEDPAKDINHKYSYDCDSWKVDEPIFVVPSDVTFVDPTEMMKALPVPTTVPGTVPSGAGSLPAGGGDMKALQCSACEQAGDQKAACKEALGCE